MIFNDDTMSVLVLRRALSEMALRQLIMADRLEELAQSQAHLIARVNRIDEATSVGGEMFEDPICPDCNAHT